MDTGHRRLKISQSNRLSQPRSQLFRGLLPRKAEVSEKGIKKDALPSVWVGLFEFERLIIVQFFIRGFGAIGHAIAIVVESECLSIVRAALAPIVPLCTPAHRRKPAASASSSLARTHWTNVVMCTITFIAAKLFAVIELAGCCRVVATRARCGRSRCNVGCHAFLVAKPLEQRLFLHLALTVITCMIRLDAFALLLALLFCFAFRHIASSNQVYS